MSDRLPQCPLNIYDRRVVDSYIERQDSLDYLKSMLAKRTFLRRLFLSAQLHYSISRMSGLQRAASDHYPHVLSDEVVAEYTLWQETLADYIEFGSEDYSTTALEPY